MSKTTIGSISAESLTIGDGGIWIDGERIDKIRQPKRYSWGASGRHHRIRACPMHADPDYSNEGISGRERNQSAATKL